ncbi:MAG: hypothetical protein CW716_08890 [Candidatus Bathyarchaeum sp.]|nr:MAG: hypothetical protein CW716_08890 [Candidatus Bathyarchaeum sp.]
MLINNFLFFVSVNSSSSSTKKERIWLKQEWTEKLNVEKIKIIPSSLSSSVILQRYFRVKSQTSILDTYFFCFLGLGLKFNPANVDHAN